VLGDQPTDNSWVDLAEAVPATADQNAIRVNRWYVDHPELVLGTHDLTSGPFGETYTCRPAAGAHLETALAGAIKALPQGICTGTPE
ncbi:hypothetical protein, partial [Acinetobacter baumannii]|uniref:hypothetical protein n=1 Tax=Acinetobacter baumannii TaxID=470 RepID=UPI001C07FC56